jgi:hypothetical protein
VTAHQFINTPKAGSIGLRLNSTSVNTVVDSLAGLLFAIGVQGKTFNMSVDQKAWYYEFSLNHVTANKIVGPMQKSFREIPGTKKIDISLSGIDINATMDAELKALQFIPVHIDGVILKNVSIDFQLESTSSDGIDFHLSDSSKVSIGDFDIKLRSGVLNKITSWFKSHIKSIVDQ